jgi:hypothetical protein
MCRGPACCYVSAGMLIVTVHSIVMLSIAVPGVVILSFEMLFGI